MKLKQGLHLAYCTNIHRGDDWRQTFDSLKSNTLAVRQEVCAGRPYAIGLRLSHQAASELNDPGTLLEFQRWLETNQCYVFTINGFPYGRFHGSRIKEQAYLPDWTDCKRLEYTNLLFDLLAKILPEGMDGSVSTVPGSYREFICTEAQVKLMRENLWRCIDHISTVSERSGHRLHLGLEPEPLCFLETSRETAAFFAQMREDRPRDGRLQEHLGVNYDTCHLAVEFEEPGDVMTRWRENGIRISKLHLSSALRVIPTLAARQALAAFADDVYFHQVISRTAEGGLVRYRDLDVALRTALQVDVLGSNEWRIHFHVPLHSPPTALFGNTSDHLKGVLDLLQADPTLCTHLEMETYTWEVLPAALKNRNVVDQLVAEYRWTLARLSERGLC